jgi:hypothetical protein
MYNPGIQVQIPADANVGSYYLLKNSLWGSSPPLSFQKKMSNVLPFFDPSNRDFHPEMTHCILSRTANH